MKKAPNHSFLLGALALSLAALFTGCPSKPTKSAAESGTPKPLTEELKSLQGHWEGEGAGGKCSVTIAGNSLHYRNSAGWYKTEFILPAGTDPQQLHATIKECSPPSSHAIGTVVFAIFKIEDGTLTLATRGGGAEGKPTSFDDEGVSRYELRKVQPPKNNTELPKPK
jgi:uncharacterized protein (TIGR03067 family)